MARQLLRLVNWTTVCGKVQLYDSDFLKLPYNLPPIKLSATITETLLKMVVTTNDLIIFGKQIN